MISRGSLAKIFIPGMIMMNLQQKAGRRRRGNNERRGYFFTEKQQGAESCNAAGV